MRFADFDFDLPPHLIATRPAVPRSAARMLVARGDRMSDRNVTDLPALLRPGDRLVLNDTRVLSARLSGERTRLSDQGETRAVVEITLLSPLANGRWRALAKPAKRVKPGETLAFEAGLSAMVTDKPVGEVELAFNLTGAAFDRALAAAGRMPLPPYIAAIRPADERDKIDYQTVFAANPGAVAAPTASLHFDERLLAALDTAGIGLSRVTLHVGAGTFLPARTEFADDHQMHAERGEIREAAAAEINETRARGGRIIPVGTTALRLIESAAGPDGNVTPFSGQTDIFIRPGYRFRVTDALMTNFHLPKSTLILLVAALMGPARIRSIYARAISSGYRFFSYGDSSLLLPDGAACTGAD